MKKTFNKPEIEFVKFNVSDVIMASIDPMNGHNGTNGDNDGYSDIAGGVGTMTGEIGQMLP